MITHALMQPDTEDTRFAMVSLNADPLYMTLCDAQQCFRARLTPKPWRCKLKVPPARFPFEDVETEAAFRQWEQTYTATAQRFSTCTLAGSVGNSVIHPAVEPLIKLHDEMTRVASDLPLA